MKYTTLTEALQELERTDPKVRAAAKAYDDTVDRLNFRARINEDRRKRGLPPLRGSR